MIKLRIFYSFLKIKLVYLLQIKYQNWSLVDQHKISVMGRSLQRRNFFNDEARYWFPAGVTIAFIRRGTCCNWNAHGDFSFWDVFTETIKCSWSMSVHTAIGVDLGINGGRWSTFSSIDCEKPATTTPPGTTNYSQVPLEGNTKSCRRFLFHKRTWLWKTRRTKRKKEIDSHDNKILTGWALNFNWRLPLKE